MKKVLEGALLSIAHRILQMKDKEDVNTLYKEAKDVFEKLAVLKFYNDNKASLEGLVSEETLEKQLAIVTANELDDSLDDTKGIIITEREQMPVDLIQEENDTKGILIDNEEEALEDIKGVLIEHEEGEMLEDTMGVLNEPNEDAILEETKGVLVTDENSIHAESRMRNSDAVKIDTVIEDMKFDKQRLAYENQFIETAFVDSIEEDESDELLHSYLDQHDAMLKQKEGNAEAFSMEEELVTYEEEDSKDEEEKVSNIETSADEEIQEAMIHPETAGLDKSQVRFEDSFLGFDFGDVDFVRVDDSTKDMSNIGETSFVSMVEKEDVLPTQSLFEFEPISSISKPKKSLNDIYNSTITIGLNDRIGFEKHLFNGSSEDLNRVLSQLNTVNSFEEAVGFIEDLVKPDYNNWEGKEAYAARFMELVEKRFV